MHHHATFYSLNIKIKASLQNDFYQKKLQVFLSYYVSKYFYIPTNSSVICMHKFFFSSCFYFLFFIFFAQSQQPKSEQPPPQLPQQPKSHTPNPTPTTTSPAATQPTPHHRARIDCLISLFVSSPLSLTREVRININYCVVFKDKPSFTFCQKTNDKNPYPNQLQTSN